MDMLKRFCFTAALLAGICGYTTFASSVQLSAPGYSLVDDDGSDGDDGGSSDSDEAAERAREEAGAEGEKTPSL